MLPPDGPYFYSEEIHGSPLVFEVELASEDQTVTNLSVQQEDYYIFGTQDFDKVLDSTYALSSANQLLLETSNYTLSVTIENGPQDGVLVRELFVKTAASQTQGEEMVICPSEVTSVAG